MKLSIIRVITWTVKRRWHNRKMAKTKLFSQRTQSYQHHTFRHRVRVEAFDWLTVEVIFLTQRKLGRIGAARANRNQFRLRLFRGPPVEHLRIHSLITNPLLSRMLEAEI